MTKLPSRGPRVMHGLAEMMKQARPLNGAAQPSAVAVPTQAQTDALRAQLALFTRLGVAEQQVANVRKVLDSFEGQSQKLPPDHPARTLIEQACHTLRTALAQAEKGKG